MSHVVDLNSSSVHVARAAFRRTLRTGLLGVAAWAAVAGIGSSGAAHADGFTPPRPRPAVAESWNWTGVYFGLGAGVAMMNPELNATGSRQADIGVCNPATCAGTFVPLVGLRHSQNAGMDGLGDYGGLATVQLGYDIQMGRSFVGGLFVDFDWNFDMASKFNNASNTNLTILGGLLNLPLSTQTLSGRVESEYSFSVGGRLGFLNTPQTLIYALAAYTHMKVKADVNYGVADVLGFIPAINAPTAISVRHSDSLHGFTIGAGIETKLSQNWSAKLEYRYTHLEDEEAFASLTRLQCCIGPIARRIQDDLKSDLDMSIHSVRAVVSYRLN